MEEAKFLLSSISYTRSQELPQIYINSMNLERFRDSSFRRATFEHGFASKLVSNDTLMNFDEVMFMTWLQHPQSSDCSGRIVDQRENRNYNGWNVCWRGQTRKKKMSHSQNRKPKSTRCKFCRKVDCMHTCSVAHRNHIRVGYRGTHFRGRKTLEDVRNRILDNESNWSSRGINLNNKVLNLMRIMLASNRNARISV